MPTEKWVTYLHDTFRTMWYVPIAFITGQTGKNVKALLNHAQMLFKQARERVSTARLEQGGARGARSESAALASEPPAEDLLRHAGRRPAADDRAVLQRSEGISANPISATCWARSASTCRLPRCRSSSICASARAATAAPRSIQTPKTRKWSTRVPPTRREGGREIIAPDQSNWESPLNHCLHISSFRVVLLVAASWMAQSAPWRGPAFRS